MILTDVSWGGAVPIGQDAARNNLQAAWHRATLRHM